MSNGNLYFDESALELVKEVYDLGGGTIVVDELPEVGEPHTVYELHQNVPPAYNWVAEINNLITDGNFSPIQNGGCLLVLETYDDMLAKVNEDTYDGNMSVFVYLRAEDRLFEYWLNKDAGEHMYTECDKVSSYTFKLKEINFYVLKSIRVDFGTPEHPLEDPIYYGTLYNGTEFSLNQYSGNDKAFILHQATFDAMSSFNATGNNVHQVSELPTAEEAVANYLDELITNNGSILFELDNQVCSNHNQSKTYEYYWDSKAENFITGKDEIYTGPLEWTDIPFPVYTEIPYQDIFDENVEVWFFNPRQGGEKVSYWIYTNNVWVNLDDVGKIVMPVTSVGDFGFNNTGLDLKYFDFYINGIKAECVQYGTLVVGGDGETEEDPRICPIGYLKGIVLPTTESNHYSVEVRFKGTLEQISGLKYLQISVLGFGDSMWSIVSNIIKQRNLLDPMTLEFDGLHEILIGCKTDTL